ncbi:MAG: BREX-2 system adenine-specific DNA-methyltransferase PglX [Planctomycetaceae bacterium]
MLPTSLRRPLIEGEYVRDWSLDYHTELLFPYTENIDLVEEDAIRPFLWNYRTVAWGRPDFSRRSYRECGRPYWEYHQIPVDRNRMPLSIVFSFLATHNHFVLDRGGKVFKQSAPIIKLPATATVDEHLSLLGLLNSSLAGFWMKQVLHSHGAGGGTRVAAGRSPLGDDNWESHYEFDSTKLKTLPIVEMPPSLLPRKVDHYIEVLHQESLSNALRMWSDADNAIDLGSKVKQAAELQCAVIGEMIRLQEDLDWQCYRLYGLIDEELVSPREPAEQRPADSMSPCSTAFPVTLGERAFEIVLARKMARGEIQTTWFDRHGSTPITELPDHWPDDYKQLVQRRIEVIESNPQIALIEQPEYKRRWNTEPWDTQVERALRSWLLDRLERYFDFDGRMNDASEATAQLDIALTSVGRLADVSSGDEQFTDVGSVYRDDPAFDVLGLVEELVAAESVPQLPILRYKATGLRKREQWEDTWDLQRREDAGEDMGEIPVPPKYKSSDFISSGGARYWALRGKLDVPKERWVSFPHCEGEDGTLMICWAGYDHLQQASAIAAHFVRVKEEIGGADDPRLVPLLACLIELLPWLKQWHNEPNAEFDGLRMGDYYEGFINEEARNLPRTTTNADGEEVTTSGWTIKEIKAWQPPQRTGGRRRRRSTT